jgi:hypothetical protein
MLRLHTGRVLETGQPIKNLVRPWLRVVAFPLLSFLPVMLWFCLGRRVASYHRSYAQDLNSIYDDLDWHGLRSLRQYIFSRWSHIPGKLSAVSRHSSHLCTTLLG